MTSTQYRTLPDDTTILDSHFMRLGKHLILNVPEKNFFSITVPNHCIVMFLYIMPSFYFSIISFWVFYKIIKTWKIAWCVLVWFYISNMRSTDITINLMKVNDMSAWQKNVAFVKLVSDRHKKCFLHRWEGEMGWSRQSSPRLKGQSWCGDLCWDDIIDLILLSFYKYIYCLDFRQHMMKFIDKLFPEVVLY